MDIKVKALLVEVHGRVLRQVLDDTHRDEAANFFDNACQALFYGDARAHRNCDLLPKLWIELGPPRAGNNANTAGARYEPKNFSPDLVEIFKTIQRAYPHKDYDKESKNNHPDSSDLEEVCDRLLIVSSTLRARTKGLFF